MLLARLVLLALAPHVRGLSISGSLRSVRPLWASATHALHHVFEAPGARLNSAQLEELSNAAIPSSEAGRDVLAFVARPANPPARPLPILVMIHEFFGLSDSIASKAQLLADELDCFVVAPDTFRGITTSFIPQAIWLALTTPQARVNADLEDVITWAGKQSGVDGKRVAVMGFCYGGGKAIRYTTEVRPTAATVIYYGSPLMDSQVLAKLRAPVCAVYGTQDAQFPQRTVDGFKAALEEADVEHEVVSYYGVGHAFWTDVAQIEDEQMPQIAAYRLTTNFLRNFYSGQESFAAKRAFLESQLAQQQATAAAPEGDGREWEEDELDE